MVQIASFLGAHSSIQASRREKEEERRHFGYLVKDLCVEVNLSVRVELGIGLGFAASLAGT
jgi:hypothetical protein